jgi:hypothetical protein
MQPANLDAVAYSQSLHHCSIDTAYFEGQIKYVVYVILRVRVSGRRQTSIVHVAAAGILRQSGGQPAIERTSEPAADDEQAAPCELYSCEKGSSCSATPHIHQDTSLFIHTHISRSRDQRRRDLTSFSTSAFR